MDLPFACISVHMSVCLPVPLSVCPSVCLCVSIHPSIIIRHDQFTMFVFIVVCLLVSESINQWRLFVCSPCMYWFGKDGSLKCKLRGSLGSPLEPVKSTATVKCKDVPPEDEMLDKCVKQTVNYGQKRHNVCDRQQLHMTVWLIDHNITHNNQLSTTTTTTISTTTTTCTRQNEWLTTPSLAITNRQQQPFPVLHLDHHQNHHHPSSHLEWNRGKRSAFPPSSSRCRAGLSFCMTILFWLFSFRWWEEFVGNLLIEQRTQITRMNKR